jgi:isoleucyl-tRNA synthetase
MKLTEKQKEKLSKYDLILDVWQEGGKTIAQVATRKDWHKADVYPENFYKERLINL